MAELVLPMSREMLHHGGGASIAWANDTARGNSIAMRDPEGNEFCVG